MKNLDFVHLHLHTEYSPLDGIIKIRDLINQAKEYGMTAVAITDHGSMSGLYEAQKYGEKQGIKVIQGCEFYHIHEDKNAHIIVLAKNDEGLRNLNLLHESSYVDGFYKKPNILMHDLVRLRSGLIVMTACLGSELNQYLLKGNMEQANLYVQNMRQIFGDDFYIEVQANSIPEQLYANQELIKLAKKYNVKYVLTNDVHYMYETDAFAHEVSLGLQFNKKFSDAKRYKFPTNDFWFKTAEEMFNTCVGLSKEEIVTAMNVTKEIEGKCNSSYKKGKYLPSYWDKSDTPRKLLTNIINKNSVELGLAKNKDYMKQVQNELNIIDEEGYCDYYLIVQDYAGEARNNGVIVGDGRGSGAGSKTAYIADITRIEPEQYGLLFERFMAHGRVPDFDIDFSDQEFVFNYLRQRYGEQNVARIIAFGTLAPKAVSRKVLSFFEKDKIDIDAISKLIPDLCESMEMAYKASPDLLKYKKKFPIEFQVIERLEGVVSHESQHAGGVVIYEGLNQMLPLKSDGSNRNIRIAAFDKYMLEELGYYKFDVLGLITLPIISKALEYIKSNKGVDVDLYKINYEDENVYKMLQDGEVSGVFQLSNQQQKVMQQKPANFRDLIAINSLIRPGVGDWNEYIARRNGKEWSVHPDRKYYMDETNGTMTYQEQFLLDCKVFAGWDLAYADKHVRKNKDIRNDEELKNKFYTDTVARKYPIEIAEQIWKEIEDAVDGGYSFNKSHSASYGVMSYQTAYLKHYYPVEFYSAMMSYEKADGQGQIQISSYIKECKKRGISILPPDINSGTDMFYPIDNSVQFRLNMITGLGDSAFESIQKLRPFESFEDFMTRRDKSKIKDNVIESLIKAGAFDRFNPNRGELMYNLLMSKRTKTEVKLNVEVEVDYNDLIKSDWEKDSTGIYLTSHPLEGRNIKEFSEYKDGSTVYIWVLVDDILVKLDKNKKEMAFLTTSTEIDQIRIVMFKDSWSQYKDLLYANQNNPIFIEGKKDGSNILLNRMEV